MRGMIGAYRLPLRFDPAPLIADIQRIGSQAEWFDHWGAVEGAWGVLPLIAADGDSQSASSIHFSPSAPPRPTPHLDDAPHLRAAIGAFRTGVLHARLSRLRAGRSIARHRDYGYESDRRWSFERGFIRVHIPLITDDDVCWKLDGTRIDMQAGEAWYLNVCRPHSVDNRSRADRIHLVLDLEVNGWVRSLFPPATAWDRLRGVALRHLEPPLWRLAKRWVMRHRGPGATARPSASSGLATARHEIAPPGGNDGSDDAIGNRR